MPAIRSDSAILRMTQAASAPVSETLQHAAFLKAAALQGAIFKTAACSIICTDETGIIQVLNAGAERMLGYDAAELVNKSTPAHLFDPLEVLARAVVINRDAGSTVAAGYEALVCKAAEGSEDSYELTHVRKD